MPSLKSSDNPPIGRRSNNDTRYAPNSRSRVPTRPTVDVLFQQPGQPGTELIIHPEDITMEATGTPAIVIPVNSDDATIGSELVIDGEVVIPPPKPQTRYLAEIILLSLTLLSTFIIIAVFVSSPSSSGSFHGSTEIVYDDFIKEIAIPISGIDALDDNTTIQHKIWKNMAREMPWLIKESIIQINETDKIAQRYAMLVVIASKKKRKKPNRTNFMSPPNRASPVSLCSLLPCNDDGEITGFALRNEWFSERGGGFIATEVGTLQALSDIIITRSSLHKTIPTEMRVLTNLRVLNLRNNSFTGIIPTQLGQLENLEVLLLDGNLFEGTIPSELAKLSKLKYLGLSQNKLTGIVPADLDTMTNLKSIALYDNNLRGNIDFMCKTNFTAGLEVLELEFGKASYEYRVDMGVAIDCDIMDTEAECFCCKCM